MVLYANVVTQTRFKAGVLDARNFEKKKKKNQVSRNHQLEKGG